MHLIRARRAVRAAVAPPSDEELRQQQATFEGKIGSLQKQLGRNVQKSRVDRHKFEHKKEAARLSEQRRAAEQELSGSLVALLQAFPVELALEIEHYRADAERTAEWGNDMLSSVHRVRALRRSGSGSGSTAASAASSLCKEIRQRLDAAGRQLEEEEQALTEELRGMAERRKRLEEGGPLEEGEEEEDAGGGEQGEEGGAEEGDVTLDDLRLTLVDPALLSVELQRHLDLLEPFAWQLSEADAALLRATDAIHQNQPSTASNKSIAGAGHSRSASGVVSPFSPSSSSSPSSSLPPTPFLPPALSRASSNSSTGTAASGSNSSRLFITGLPSSSSSRRGTAASSSTAGRTIDRPWAAEEAARFRRVFMECSRAGVTRAHYMERLALEFPGRSQKELLKRDEEYRQHRHAKRQLQAAEKAWRESAEGILRAARAALRLARVEDEVAPHREAKEEADAAERERKQIELELQRIERREREERKREEDRIREEQEAQRRAAAEAAEAARRQQIKAQLDDYHRRVQEEQEQWQALEAEKARLAAVERSKLAAVHQARIEYRQELLRQREAAREEQQARALEEAKRREARLDELRQQVSVEAARDPARLLQLTESAAAAVAAAADSSAAPSLGPASGTSLFPVYGYSDTTVLADKRARLAMALREAGLMNSQYARGVLSATEPFRAPRPDMVASRVFE